MFRKCITAALLVLAGLAAQAQNEMATIFDFKAKATGKMLKCISKTYKEESDIRWNFTKFLVSRDGSRILRFAPTTEPKDFEKDIEEML